VVVSASFESKYDVATPPSAPREVDAATSAADRHSTPWRVGRHVDMHRRLKRTPNGTARTVFNPRLVAFERVRLAPKGPARCEIVAVTAAPLVGGSWAFAARRRSAGMESASLGTPAEASHFAGIPQEQVTTRPGLRLIPDSPSRRLGCSTGARSRKSSIYRRRGVHGSG